MRDFLDPYGFKMPEIVGTSSAYVFSAEYQTVYDSFVVKPAVDIAQQQDIMVRALVTAGIWAILDQFLVFSNVSLNDSLINWINPGINDATTVLAAGQFAVYNGWTGDGITWIDTHYNPFTDAINLAQNSNFWSVALGNDVAAGNVQMGAMIGGVFHQIRPRDPANNFDSANMDAADLANAHGGSTTAFFTTARNGVLKESYYNFTRANANSASTGVPNGDLYLLGRNGAPNTPLLSLIRIHAIGGYLAEAGVTNYLNYVNDYLEYIGVGILP